MRTSCGSLVYVVSCWLCNLAQLLQEFRMIGLFIEHLQFLLMGMVGVLAAYRRQSLVAAIVMVLGFFFAIFVSLTTGRPVWIDSLSGSNAEIRHVLFAVLTLIAIDAGYFITRCIHDHLRPAIAEGFALTSLFMLVVSMGTCLGMFGLIASMVRAGWYETSADAVHALFGGSHALLTRLIIFGAVVYGFICVRTMKRQMSTESPVSTSPLTDH